MVSDMHEPSNQIQPSSDSESIIDKEDDVKVCDICGDAGQEDSLAICNRCLDGAEHIYCMETMLDELPDGDWLCEGCKFKEEYKNQNLSKFEVVTQTQEQSNLDEDAQHGRSTIYSEAPLKKNGSVIKEDMVDSKTLKMPQIHFMMHGENVDLSTVTCEKVSKGIPVSSETLVPQDVSLLFPENSLTNRNSETTKQSNPEQSSGTWSIFKGQKAQTSSGPLLKPSSLTNTNTKPKVKQVLPLAENATGKYLSKNTKKGGPTGEMVISTSFKTGKGGCNGFEVINEKQSALLTQIKNSGLERKKELGVLERDNSSVFQIVDRKLIDGGNSGVALRHNREIPIHSSRNSISASSSGLNLQFQIQGLIPKEGFHHYVNATNNSRKHDTVSQCNNHLSLESTHQVRIAASSTTSNKPISGGSRIIQCQKCNETGHPTHLCSIEKHCVSVSWKNANTSNKSKPARETVMPKQEALKCTHTTDQSMDLPIPCFGHSADDANKELPSHCFRGIYSLVGRTNTTSSFVLDKTEPTVHSHVANQTEIHHEVGECRLNPCGDISKEFDMKPSEQVLPSIDPCLSNTLRTSVIPELKFFWQGGFEVFGTGRLLECYDGLQAHFSSYASGKVLEVAKRLPPYKVQLEEVPCISSWPQCFHGNHAKEQNIAVFFFAKDIESYRSNYCKLLERMLMFDLALKGNLGGFELLIFPSNKLSEKSQRWNRLMFLWGTFKGKMSSCLEMLPNGKQDPCKSTMDVKLSTILPEASNYHEKTTSQNSYEADKYVTHVEVTPTISTIYENKICSAHKYLCHASVDVKITPGNPCPPPVVHLPEITSQTPSLHNTCSDSSMQQKTA